MLHIAPILCLIFFIYFMERKLKKHIDEMDKHIDRIDRELTNIINHFNRE